MRWQGRNLRAGLSGSDVAELQEELIRLGFQVPEAERAQQHFGVGTAEAVAAFQTAHGMVDTAVVDRNTAAVLESATADTPTALMRVQPPPTPVVGRAPVSRPPVTAPPAATNLAALSGKLFSDRGDAPAGVKLRFYRPQFGGRKALVGEAVTGADGGYQLEIGDQAGIEVYAVGADGKEHPLGGPGNVVIPAAKLPKPQAEYARLIASVQPHLGGGKLGEAREDDERRDLTLLHEATKWDGRLLALGAGAEKLADTVGVTPQVAYGLMRAGLPSDPVQLARIGQAGIGHALRKAVEAGVVELNERDIANAQTTLGAFGRTTRRKLAVNGTASSYGSMLSASGLAAADQNRFDEIFSAHSGDAGTLWRSVRDAGLPADQLRLTAQLGALTLNSARLTESLRVEVGAPERLAEKLVEAKLYQPAAWADRLNGLAGGNERVLGQMIPTAYQGETVAERLAAYTADLAFKVRRSYPTQVLGDRVRSGELPLASNAPAQDVATVLDRAAGAGFVPGQQPLSRFLADKRETVFAGMPADRAKAATAEVATLTRQYQITASDEALAALQRHDLRSAAQVSAMPQRVFMAKYAADFPTPAEAELTWRRAQQVTAVTLNLVALTKQLDSFRLLPAMGQPSEVVSASQADLVKQFPTLESLFGSLDYCECAHCRSVLSPAAYLVDLLKFLDDAPALPKSPYTALTQRRPDLPHLPLTCENTNVALPYIDVVNEILEFYLAHNAQLTPEAAYDTGDASSEDLIAEPQNLLPAAYDLLKQAKYPLTGPFDLWLATVRTFVEHFEVRFADVLEVLRMSDELHPAAGYGLAAVAYERLGSSPAELALLTAADPLADWPVRYGYAPNATPSEELAGARTLARKLGITYRELVSLLRTRFIRPLVLADPPGVSSCNWEETTLRRAGGSAAEPIDFLLLNHFVRIWRRLGWSIDETDQALMTFLPTTPDPRTGTAIGAATGSALLGIARLIQLAQLLNARPADRRELLVLWAPLTDARYEQLFLTGTTQIRDAAFAGTPGAYLTTPGVLLADHLEPVLAALRLSNADTGLILRHAGQDPATAELTMASVSLLHRHAVLARMLHLKIPDLLTLIDLTGLDPFAQTIQFVETVQRLEASGLSAGDADFLVRHRFDPVGPLRAHTQPPLALVRTLAAEVTRIRTEFAIPGDPLAFTDDVVARALALVLDAPVAAAFLAAWTGRAPLPDAIFQEHLHRHTIAGVGEVGFLDAGDPAILFTMPGGDQAADRNRRARLAQTLLPYIQQRLTRQAVVDAEATASDADPALVESLLRDDLDAYVAASAYGLTVAGDRTTGYIELPPGHYQFTVACAVPGTTVTLTLDHLSDPVLSGTSADGNLAFVKEVELRGAVAYGFTLTHTPGAQVTLSVRGQRLTTTPVSGLSTYRRAETEALHLRHLLLVKALMLASRLSLGEAELRLGTLDLGALPTVEDLTPGNATVRFGQLLRVIDYVRLRDELAADPADLLNIFARAQRPAPADEVLADVTALTARMVRREPEAVRAAAGLLGLTAAGFADERGLTRLWRVLALAARIGVGPAELGRWATPSPDRAVAQDVQGTVKAKYSAEQWRRVAQPIFDKLRKQRRDALVAQVLQVTGYGRVEQLFEHFLVDPATEPVVQTSRLRLAMSSVQTFIQRCLLNLERDVSPSSINADYWEWMKRYRVWEANRKIFLWPENWLEPEFRDDKTHLYAALESALLESDLGSDAVEKAFFGYLHGLDEIARLNIRAIYLERKQDKAANVLHVVGRTGGSPHKYFYRTWSRRSWTPWTPVTASIDGDHLAMVMWQGRVHLFWVVFLPKPEPKTQSSNQKAADVPLSTLTGNRPRLKVEAQLFWSCYTPAGAGPGEWSDPVMAIAEEPLVKTVNDDFDASKVFIWADVLTNGRVSISLLGQGADQSFQVISKHAPPVHSTAHRVPLEPPYLASGDVPLTRAGQGRWRGAAPKFRVHVEGETITDQGVNPCDITEDIFAKAPSTYDLVIVPPPAKLTKGSTKGGGKGGSPQQPQHRPEDPFFYMDTAHNFFVEPAWLEFSINDGDQAIAAQPPVWHEFDQPEFWKDRPIVAAFPDTDGPVAKPVDVITRPNAVIRFNGGIVGRTGRITEGRILRTGPHGAPIRTDLSNRDLS